MKRIVILFASLACASSTASAQHAGYITINGVRMPKCEQIFATREPGQSTMLEPLRDLIENIEVVKGARAVQQYGPDAAQGAILIDLKKGATVPGTLCDAPKAAEPFFYSVEKPRGQSAAPPPTADPVAGYLYTPELVIAHQDAIGLTGDQRMAIKVLQATSGLQIIQTQWRLSAGTEKLATLLAGPVVDEAAVLQQIDQVLALEREVKRAQLSMLVHVKNQLTAAQQQKLDKFK